MAKKSIPSNTMILIPVCPWGVLTIAEAWVLPPEILIYLVWGSAWAVGPLNASQAILVCSQE